MSEEKSTSHNVIVWLLSETAITHASAVYALAKSIDTDTLEESDLIIMGYDFPNAEPGSNHKKDREPSRAASKIRDLASRSPGALGKIYSLVKGRKWHEIYIGFVGFVLIGVLLSKWLIRLIAGTF